MRIRASAFYRSDRRHAHDSVAQPIAAPNQNPERFQLNTVGQKNTALVFREEEIWPWRFPAIVHPEPIFRYAPDLFFHNFITARRQLLNRFARAFDWRSGNCAPARKTVGMNGEPD